MADRFSNFTPTLDAPSFNAYAVVTSDGTPLATVSKGLYIGGAGNVVVIPVGYRNETPVAVTFVAVPAGTTLNIRAAYVKATGTTATNIVALY